MLTPISILFTPDSFITRQESGVAGDRGQFHWCKVTFDTDGYHDALFAHYRQPLPDFFPHAVIRRKAEYLAGRYCCEQLLHQAGCQQPVMQDGRAPRWPVGFAGAISHSGNQAIAVLSPDDEPTRIGVDIEYLEQGFLAPYAEEIASQQEVALLTNRGIDYELGLLVTFSAKESLFKALWPEVRHYFGFDNAALVAISPTRGHFTLELTRPLTPDLPAGLHFTGCYQFHAGYITTLLG